MEWMLMPLRRYAEFSGRSRRMEYWMFALFNAIVMVVLFGLLFASSGMSLSDIDSGPGMDGPGVLFWLFCGLLVIYVLAIFIPSIAVVIRRLHDRDMSGWWYLGAIVAGLIPFVGFLASIALLVIMCLPGTPGPNRFGPDPKDPASAKVFA